MGALISKHYTFFVKFGRGSASEHYILLQQLLAICVSELQSYFSIFLQFLDQSAAGYVIVKDTLQFAVLFSKLRHLILL